MVNLGSSFEQTMMGPRPQCYIPSNKGPLVLEKKIFEGCLPYMGVVAILVMWPIPREQTFVPPSQWGSIWNLALIGQGVLEKKIFENGGWQTDDGPWLYYKLTYEPKGSSELKTALILLLHISSSKPLTLIRLTKEIPHKDILLTW